MSFLPDFSLPWLLALLPLALLPLLPRRGDALVFPSLAWLPADRLGCWMGWIAQGGAVIAMLAIIVGLAGPGRPHRQVLRTGSGAQILILMDRSASMDETMNSKGVGAPVGESKSHVARASLTQFVAQRPHDQLAFMMFGTSALLVMPFTYDHPVIDAAIAGTAVGRGMPDTQLDRGLLTAIGEFDGRHSSGRRAIVLVSDGGARLDERVQRLVRDGLLRDQIALYFIYLRSSVYSPDLNAAAPASGASAEAELHRYFSSLSTPYRLFQAGNAKAMKDAMAEINRQQNARTTFVEHVPRQDLSPYCFAVALAACALLVLLRVFQVRGWS
ncbi:vWA domain-containing protein [Paraburkholderia unamae]|uniref:MxaC protein n=1 Tax=Paraburkholderia unamae TaxID=219649 RepID=A0ABX5KFL0_9BURK|nr:vWA domain-containing protein [Paraburkholderia unamae]PVX77031.1 mxaC protein [Paraburkholderia unamae]CAG9260484.1 VWA domain-containing protein [Paraburkholderia unamae]